MNEISEYWDRRPCNVGHGISPVGTEEWSTEVAIRKYFVEPHIVWFADFARWKDKKVLEIGCGIGTDTREFIRHGVGHIDAMDISSGSLNLAAKRSWQVLNKRQLNLPDKLAWDNPVATFHLANAEDFQPLGPFNLIYSF
jgi:SAM-dependent methyltransferase